MQGKILSPQLISGDDGKRYEYDKNDVVNLGNKDLALLTGSQVEFVSFDVRVAKSIYISAENLNVSGILSADSIRSARANALLGLGLQIFNFIPYIGQIIAIVGFVLYSMAIYSVRKAAASKSLFKNYIIALIINFLGLFFAYMLAPILGTFLLIIAILSGVSVALPILIIILIAAIYLYKIHAELARLSGSSLFLWAFWMYVVSVLLWLGVFGISLGFAFFITFVVFAVSIIASVLLIALVLLFVAWWRFGKVEKKVINFEIPKNNEFNEKDSLF
ncbi:MAG: hypothetical protein SPH77_01885 [Campylobacter sp.]|uniref:hypothetical protein n=1 Tax=Campylobacter sp. TaxID=205 RepID=UPI002A91BA32|nr:hypothetical protein [Campylobacter sp.]MDY6187570.1 hypothetical protein [Campylobacter sp.]